MPGAFDAFLYLPATPPTTPSPTKKQPRTSLPSIKSPGLGTLAPVILPSPSPSSVSSKKREYREVEEVDAGRRKSPRLELHRQQSQFSVVIESSAIATSTSPTPRSRRRSIGSNHVVPAELNRKNNGDHDDSAGPNEKISKRKKKRKAARPYADPALYAHLPQHVRDTIDRDLTLLIVGLNPGVMTAATGNHFANPTNLFWPLLYHGRIIHEPLKAADSHVLPERYGIGITNIVGRPTAEGGELSRAECVAGCRETIKRIQKWRPAAVAFTGKGIWESMFTALHGRGMKRSDEFAFGWQKEVITTSTHVDGIDNGAGIERGNNNTETKLDDSPNQQGEWTCRIFVTMGTSGRVAAYTPAYKRQVFAELGEWVNQHRSNKARSIGVGDDDKDNIGSASGSSSEQLQREIEVDVQVKEERDPFPVFADDYAVVIPFREDEDDEGENNNDDVDDDVYKSVNDDEDELGKEEQDDDD